MYVRVFVYVYEMHKVHIPNCNRLGLLNVCLSICIRRGACVSLVCMSLGSLLPSSSSHEDGVLPWRFDEISPFSFPATPQRSVGDASHVREEVGPPGPELHPAQDRVRGTESGEVDRVNAIQLAVAAAEEMFPTSGVDKR